MASSLGNATTRGEAIISNTRATLMDLLLQDEVAKVECLTRAVGSCPRLIDNFYPSGVSQAAPQVPAARHPRYDESLTGLAYDPPAPIGRTSVALTKRLARR